jgi:wyosine [tRNA(Phe)-imidazoG37] synthetase (radical SAM superfamily)
MGLVTRENPVAYRWACEVSRTSTRYPRGISHKAQLLENMLAFGPVPSRRLGRSLGVNNVPPKVCSYGCVYCQVGRTREMTNERRAFYQPAEILESVREKLKEAQAADERIDFLTFAPDGEPTLDVNLGQHIALMRPLGFPIAVISNASLVWREDVRHELERADWVSLKVDAVREAAWHRVNRPHGKLSLPAILEGVRVFAQTFTGKLVTETLLVAGVNDSGADLEAVARFLGELQPAKAYIATPTRPPTETWVRPVDDGTLIHAYHTFAERVQEVEYLIKYEGEAFASLGNTSEALLSILAVHPMREDAVLSFLSRAGANSELAEHLAETGLLTKVSYRGKTFYIRRTSGR